MKKTTNAALRNGSRTIDVKALDDSHLIDLLLDKDGAAWREFMRRFDKVLRHQVGKVTARAMRTVLPSDAVDDVMGDFFLDLMEEDMRKLRIWANGPRTARLASWLGMLATQRAVDHIRSVYRTGRNERAAAREDRDADPNRGGNWLGKLSAAGEAPKRTRRRTERTED